METEAHRKCPVHGQVKLRGDSLAAKGDLPPAALVERNGARVSHIKFLAEALTGLLRAMGHAPDGEPNLCFFTAGWGQKLCFFGVLYFVSTALACY